MIYIPELILEHVDEIRIIDIDALIIEVDLELYSKELERCDYDANVPRIDELLPHLIGNTLSSRGFVDVVPLGPKIAEREHIYLEVKALLRLFILVMMWTYGRMKCGQVRLAEVLANVEAGKTFCQISAFCYHNDFLKAYQILNRPLRWNMMLPVTHFLYFLCRDVEAPIKPLIFDRSVGKTLNTFGPLAAQVKRIVTPQNHPIRSYEAYSQYLILMHNWAGVIHCRPDQLVEFLRIRGMGGAE